MSHLIPDRQRQAKVYVLGAVQFMVYPVVVRTHQYPSQGAETQIRVRVLERHECRVGH